MNTSVRHSPFQMYFNRVLRFLVIIFYIIRFIFFIFGVLTPHSTIFQLYHGDQF